MDVKKAILGLGGLVLTLAVLAITLGWQHNQKPMIVSSDVSWPNCMAAPPNDAFGIVGLTGGLDFKQNKCVRSEVSWFPEVALYMNTGWPGTSFHLQFPNSPRNCGRGDTLCLAYNYGFHAASYAIAYANSQLVHSSQWWLDVETENSWSSDTLQNQAALQGMVAATEQQVFAAHIGFYSYPGQWTQIVGNWHPDFPAWAATGSTSRVTAQEACLEPSFTGGAIKLSQYTLDLDQDYQCSIKT